MNDHKTYCTHDFGVCVSARYQLEDNQNTSARIARALDALDDGEYGLAREILEDLGLGFAAINGALSNMIDRFDGK